MPRILYLVHNLADPSVGRRVAMFRQGGAEVEIAGFRRGDAPPTTLPLALSLHEGSGQNAPMAHAVIGGLISSTALTLLVVPVLLTYIDSFSAFTRRFLPRSPDEVEHNAPAE